MKAFRLITVLAGVATLLTACAGGAPRAPLGLQKRPANSPETITRLTTASEPAAFRVTPAETATRPALKAVLPDAALPSPPALPDKMTVSDFNAPEGAASLPAEDRRRLIEAANLSREITLYARTDHWKRSPVSTQAALARGVRVKRYLVRQGVPEGKIRLMYRSADGFVTPNRTQAERAMNRRVEIVFS